MGGEKVGSVTLHNILISYCYSGYVVYGK